MKTQCGPELMALAKEIGNFIQYWGFKKIHGQIWTLVFLSKQPLNSTIITKKLNVSKALVSLAIKDLLFYKVIEVVEKKNKEIYFRSNPDIYSVIQHVLKTRETVMLEKIMKTHEDFKSTNPCAAEFKIDSDKIEELGFMIMAAQGTLQNLISNDLEKT